MERNGELAKPDPWGLPLLPTFLHSYIPNLSTGFMEAEHDVAVGSSGTEEPISNEAIALGITDSALADLRAGNRKAGSATTYLPGYKTSIGGNTPAAAAVKAGRRAINENDVSRSPSPEFDPGAGKNKGRRGYENETYASRYGAYDDDDDDDDEAAFSDGNNSMYSDDDDNVVPPTVPSSRTAAAAKPSSSQPSRRPRFDDGDSENDSPPSAAPRSRALNPDTDFVDISAPERQHRGIPASMALTCASLARFKQRKGDEGRLAMRQNASGDIDEA